MAIDWDQVPAAIWRPRSGQLRQVRRTDPIAFSQLLGVEVQKRALIGNTEKFLRGQPANNVLLWGSRGTGKSSLIKALLNEFFTDGLRIIEVDKDELVNLPEIVDNVRDIGKKFIVYCDDLSFEEGERTYKALKSVLEGSIELPPENVLVYATSNRRHLLPEYMAENLTSKVVNTEIHHGEAIEEKISLSDRFGLWISFYPFNQQDYLAIIDHYFADLYIGIESSDTTGWSEAKEQLHKEAIQFATQRGGRSGRTAWQFYKNKVK